MPGSIVRLSVHPAVPNTVRSLPGDDKKTVVIYFFTQPVRHFGRALILQESVPPTPACTRSIFTVSRSEEYSASEACPASSRASGEQRRTATLSGWRPINCTPRPAAFRGEPTDTGPGCRSPAGGHSRSGNHRPWPVIHRNKGRKATVGIIFMRSPSVEHHPIIIGTALHLHADAKHLGQLRIQMPKGIADLDSSPAADSIGQRQRQGGRESTSRRSRPPYQILLKLLNL